MVAFTPREEFLKIINNEKIKRFPEVIPINTPVLEEMDSIKTYWPEGHRNLNEMIAIGKSTLQTGFNAINIPFDMAVEAEALGCEIVWSNKKVDIPQVREAKIRDITGISIDEKILQKGRIPLVLKVIAMQRKNFPDYPIIPLLVGPFTLACMITDINDMFKIMITDQQKSMEILDKMADFCILYGAEQYKNGADAVLLLDPNVSGLGANQFENILIPVYRKITDKLKKGLIIHICGNIKRILKLIPECGFDGLSFDNPAMDIEFVKDTVGDKMKLIGAVPTVSCILGGTEADVFDKSLDSIKKGVDLLAPSCCLPPNSKLNNLKKMAEAIKYWNENN